MKAEVKLSVNKPEGDHPYSIHMTALDWDFNYRVYSYKLLRDVGAMSYDSKSKSCKKFVVYDNKCSPLFTFSCHENMTRDQVAEQIWSSRKQFFGTE